MDCFSPVIKKKVKKRRKKNTHPVLVVIKFVDGSMSQQFTMNSDVKFQGPVPSGTFKVCTWA